MPRKKAKFTTVDRELRYGHDYPVAYPPFLQEMQRHRDLCYKITLLLYRV